MSNIDVKQYEFNELSRKSDIKSAIESMLFVSGEPLPLREISNNLELKEKNVVEILQEMTTEYEDKSRGIRLISLDEAYQLVTKSENSEFVQKLLKKNKKHSLSQASIESLAIIAYKQPITRIDIDEIRGVKSESAITRLVERGLIKDVGRLEVPGRPILYGTTDEFLRQFGLKTIKELPSLDLYGDEGVQSSMDLLNKAIEENRIKDVIMLDEALHEKKIALIADEISRRKNTKIVLIAGPSSSGKTTFAQRLGIQLKINGLKPVTISVDNYFVERKDTPKDKDGNYDFESIEAIDLNLFNDHLTKLLNGEEIEMPEFDFHVGTKRYKGKKMRLEEDQILVIEGIHCLNDRLTAKIPKENKFKIYISALTVLNMDYFNRISTTDNRLVRRIVRDYKFRGYSAIHTLKSWASVNRGEEQNIFPFQEEADAMFNTSLIYELAVLKDIALSLLEEITNKSPEYAEAQRLKNMLKYFEAIPEKYVPTNSLLKEFIGGGDFKY